MQQLIFELSENWDKSKEIFSNKELSNEEKIEKLKEMDEFHILDRYAKRNKTDIDEALDFLSDFSSDEFGMNLSDIKEDYLELKELFKTNSLDKIHKTPFIKDDVYKGLYRDGILLILNLFNLHAKDKVNKSQLYKFIKKEKSLDFRNSTRIIQIYSGDSLFEDSYESIHNLFGEDINVNEFYAKLIFILERNDIYIKLPSNIKKFIIKLMILCINRLSVQSLEKADAFNQLVNKFQSYREDMTVDSENIIDDKYTTIIFLFIHYYNFYNIIHNI